MSSDMELQSSKNKKIKDAENQWNMVHIFLNVYKM